MNMSTMPRRTSSEPPKWPDHVRYLHSSPYHPSVSPAARSFIQGDTVKPSSRSSTKPRSMAAIRRISDTSHPACGQFGLFAPRKISPKTHIIDYIGEIHSDERCISDYDLSLHRFQNGESIGIDASCMGNEARFINDFRGVKGKPNAVFVDYRTDTGELRMGVWSANEEIRKGEEILVSYGKAWWRARTEH